MTAVLCCAAGGYTALEAGENCDWLSATGSEAAGFMASSCLLSCQSSIGDLSVSMTAVVARLTDGTGGGKSRSSGGGQRGVEAVHWSGTGVPGLTTRLKKARPSVETSACPSTFMGRR